MRPSRGITSYEATGSSESVRYPCPIVVPNGPSLARSGSTWIHWWSTVAAANASIFSCGISIQLEGPKVSPAFIESPPDLAPANDGRRPRVSRPGREQQDCVAVADPAVAHGAVEPEKRVD